MSFYRFLIRRLFLMVPLLFGIIFVTFMLVRIGGQDAVGMLAGPMADGHMGQLLAGKCLISVIFTELECVTVGKQSRRGSANGAIND